MPNLCSQIRIVLCLVGCYLPTCNIATAQTNPAAKQSAASPEDGAPTVDVEAKAVLERGLAHLKAKEFTQAVNAFAAVAKRYPKNGQFRHLLGVALLQSEKSGPAWLQFRAAVRLSPSHAPAVRGFLVLWQVFDQKGVFNIGRSSQEIEKLLGSPERKLGDESRQIWEYGFMRLHFNGGRLFAVIDPRGLDAERSRPVDAVQVEFDDKERWRLGYRSINRVASQTEYVPKNQSVQQWQELYTVQRLYAQAQTKTPRSMMKQIETNLKKMNPKIEFKTLLDQDGDVLFHWRDAGDKSEKRPPQHEIVRLIAGEKDIHRLAYARRIPQIPTTDAQAWINLLRQATLKKTDTAKQLDGQ